MPFVEYNGEVISNKSDNVSKTDKTFEKDAGGFKLSTQEDLQNKVGNDWWHGPASLIAAGATGYGVKAAWDWLKSKEAPPTPRIEPTFGGNTPPSPPPPSDVPKGWEEIIAKSNANAAAKAADAAAKANPVPTGYQAGIPNTVSPMSQLTAPQPPAQPSVSEAVATGGNVDQAVKQTVADLVDEKPVAPPQELLTGTGKPAYAGQGPAAEIRTKGKKAGEPMLRNNYAKIEDVPAGYAFVPGAQHIDTSRTNIGQTEYTKAYTSRPFPVSNEMAVQESNEINRLLGRPTRAEAKAAGLTLPPQTPGITKHVLESKGTPFMGTKAAKVGGVLGALIAIPDLVNAQTVGQRGMAGANLLESVLPLGAQINEAGAPTLSPEQIQRNQIAYENQFKLGSPYAQTEAAKAYRLQEKVGAGRGIAPPSAYR